MDVWYVSYGSNICEDRFMCYITGDRPPGSDMYERGCQDKTPPKMCMKAKLFYPLYFAKEQSKWGAGGVAFIDHNLSQCESTIGRMFLITDQQFCEVVAQENNEEGLTVNFNRVMEKGFLEITDGWYGRVVYLGDKDGCPMFTFTNNEPMEKQNFVPPSSAYLSTIANGLLELGLHKRDIINYFLNKQGIEEYFSYEALSQYIFQK